MSAPTAVSRSERWFRRLLLLFPTGFREQYGEDMAELFRDQLRGAHARAGARGVTALWLHTLPAVAWAAVLERRDGIPHVPQPRSESMLSTIGSDLRFAGRMLRKSPLFTLVAVLCVSLGSGAVTTIFSAMNALILRPLPGVGGAERLVRVERTHAAAEGFVSLPFQYYEQVRAHARTLDGLAAWSKLSLTVRRGDEMGTAIYGNYVSGDFFTVLGVRPALGRFFLPEEDRTEATHPVIVVSHDFWRSHLGADSGAVGRDVVVNGHRFTLVGVAPPDFRGPDVPIESSAWVPLRTRALLQPRAGPFSDPNVTALNLAARLRPGVDAAAAQLELERLTAAYQAEFPEPEFLRAFTDVRLTPLTALPRDARRAMAGFLGLLLGAAALVLLIASVNVAALLSARAIARRREMAVRAAMGAARRRLVGQLLTEILLLFALGAAGGAALALAATTAFERLPIPGEIPIRLELSPDPRVFGFTLLVSLLTGVIVGLAPAWRAARTDVVGQLRDGAAGASARRTLLGDVLVVGQLALSLVLLVGAGLFVRVLQHGARMDPGFDGAGVVTTQIDAESWGYDERRAREFSGALRERLLALPGVTAVSYATGLPLTLRSSGDNIQPGGPAPAGADGELPIQLLNVDAGYFDVLRIPIVAGREIRAQDDERAVRVAVVNQTLARRLQPDGQVIGRTFGFRGERVTIVGVARDAKHVSLAEATQPLAYFPLAQRWEARHALLVRSSAEPQAMARAVQAAMHAIDVEVPRPKVVPLEEAMSIGLLPQRVAALVTGALGAVGLLLATVGLYGIVAYSAGRRMREIGIRLAVGARSADVLRMIVREGMRLTAVGVALGLLLAAAATRLMAGLLFGVGPLDAVAYLSMSAVFVAVALLASWLPARRAARASPMIVLRTE